MRAALSACNDGPAFNQKRFAVKQRVRQRVPPMLK
jgi:hypothetical protein